MRFSEELIKDIRAYFSRRGAKLSDAEANAYLEKLGNLGLVVCDLLTVCRSAGPRTAAEITTGGGAPVVSSEARGRHPGGTELVSQYPQTPVVGDS